jgi:iron complex outermembrane receptor protein
MFKFGITAADRRTSRRKRRRVRQLLRPLTGIVLFCAALAAIPAPVAAERSVPDLTEMSLEQLMGIPVYAAARREQKSSEVASTVTVITSQEIRDYGWRTLADVLNAVPGLYATYDRAYQYIGVRGFSRNGDYNSRVLILLNGTRVNEPLYDTGGVGNDAIVNLETVDRVEVVRGSATSFYGNNALLAVVNIITRDGAELDGGTALVEVGSGELRRGLLTYGQQHPSGLGILVSASRTDQRGQDLYFPEYDTPETGHGLALDMDRERHQEFLARLTRGAWDCQITWMDRSKRTPTASYGTMFNGRGTRDDDARLMSSLTYSRDIADRTNLQATLSHSYYTYDGYFVIDMSEAQDGSEPLMNRDRASAAWWRLDVKATSSRLSRQKITAGMEFGDNYRLNQSNFDEGAAGFNFQDRRRSSAAGVYLEDEIKIATWARLLAGLRYERIDQLDEDRLSPRTALLLSPAGGGTLKLLYGEAYRAPNPYEMYYNDDNIIAKANPDLKLETIRTYEVVYERRLGERAFGSAAVFSYTIEDLISQIMDPDDGLLQYDNTGRASADGLELSLHYQVSGAVTGAVSYSRIDASDDKSGAWLSNSPHHLARARLTAPLLWRNLRAGYELMYDSGRLTLDGNTTDDPVLANVNVLWTGFLGNFDLSLTVYNALDQAYGYPGGEEHVQDAIPADGRNFRLRSSCRF